MDRPGNSDKDIPAASRHPEGTSAGDNVGANNGAPDATNMLGETDVGTELRSADVRGANKSGDNDEPDLRNERVAMPDTKAEADDGPVTSSEMLDKDARAEAELGKGRGVHPIKQGGIQ